jgi:hypothetical protein
MTKQYLRLSTIFLGLRLALATQPVQASPAIQAHEEKGGNSIFTPDDNVELNLASLTDNITADADIDEPGTRQYPDHLVSHSRANGVYPAPFLNYPEMIPAAADQCRPGHDLGCRNDNRRFFGASPADTPGNPVPAPAGLLLICSGLAGLVGLGKRRRKH